MVKRIGILFLALMLGVFVWQTGVLAASSDHVKDDMEYLNAAELQNIEELIQKAVQDYSLDLAIVITDNTEGKSSRDFADDYYDNNGFGVGSDYSGLLLLVNMGAREIWISTTGRAIDIFTDARISSMTDAIAGLLSNGSYYDACREFVNQVGLYSAAGIPEGQHRVEYEGPPRIEMENSGRTSPSVSPTYWSKAVALMKSFPVYIAALLIAGIAIAIASAAHKGRVTVNNQTYEGQGSFNLVDTHDDYIRETTTRTRIVKNNTSGGGSSSFHGSSSGRAHGGGGRKF